MSAKQEITTTKSTTKTSTKPQEYQYERYVTDKDNLKATLERYGVAIIPNVLNEQECKDMVSGQWDFFEHISQNWEKPINRNDKKTWSGFYTLFPSHSMLFQHWGVGHAQVSWDLRQNPKIVDIFAKFWEVEPEELLVSFDGFSFNPPPEETNRGWNRNNTWYHTDQRYAINDFQCMQSWVTGLDVEDGDATLAFYEGSHTLHEEFADSFDIMESEKANADWYKLNRDEEEFYRLEGCEQKKIKCPKGSLVFWDSRTIHCGAEALKTRKNKKFRSVVYLCYKSRSLATEANLKKKKKAFNELRTMNHWPVRGKLFGKNPRTYGNPLPETLQVTPPTLTPLGMKLAGF